MHCTVRSLQGLNPDPNHSYFRAEGKSSHSMVNPQPTSTKFEAYIFLLGHHGFENKGRYRFPVGNSSDDCRTPEVHQPVTRIRHPDFTNICR